MSLSKSLVADATKRYCACTILSELAPEEIWRYMLQFVEDIDLHTLAKVCHTFRRFSADPVLWRRVVLHRNSFRLQLRFALPQRPSRIELASRGILRSSSSSQILARHIDEGRYVNGPLGVQNFRAGRAVERTFTRSALGRLLLARPDVDELCNRGVFSEDVAASFKASCPSKHNKYAPSSPAVRVISPRLLPKMTVLRSALRRDKLKHSLQNRKSFQEIRDLNVTKPRTLWSVLPSTLMMLTKHLTGLQLQRKLKQRPNIEWLESRKVMQSAVYTAHILCPSVRPKIAYYESLSIVE